MDYKGLARRTDVRIILLFAVLVSGANVIYWLSHSAATNDTSDNTQSAPVNTPSAPIAPPRVESNSSPAVRPTPPTPKESDEHWLTPKQANEIAKPSTPVEYQLAVADAGYLIPKNDASVREFRKLLITLRKKTGYSFADIRQKSMFACLEVSKRTGLPIKLYGFMQMSLDLVERYPNDNYNVILAGMVVNSELFKQQQ